MKDTVFSPSFGNRPSQLVGRDAVVQGFLDGLDEMPGGKRRATLVLGQRGFGKTVLLWEFGDRARERGYVVATPTISTEGMLARIVEKIQDDGERYIGERKNKLSGGTVGAFGFSAGLQFTREVQESKSPAYKLTQLCRRLSEQGRGVLILVDEVQADSSEMRQLVVTYQELVGEGLDVAIAMAGLPAAVSATLNDHVLTFLNRAYKMQLEPLAFEEVDAFYKRAFDSLGIAVDSETRRRAARATQGSPYLLQLIGHNMVCYACNGAVDDAVLDDAVANAREEFKNDVCRTTLAALSQRDGDFLRAMARDEGPSKMADVASRMGVTPDYAQKYRKRLIDAGVVAPANRGFVSFAVPHLADYLRDELAAL